MLEKSSLLLDIGNTAAKLAWFDGQVLSGLRTIPIAQLYNSIDLSGVQKVWFSNVNTRQLSRFIKDHAAHYKVSCEEVLTTPKAFGLTCGYSNYPNLGVDRWLAMLAIHQTESLPFAVIDAGTALTCDIVDGSAHVGGWIAPGFDLMRSALQNGAKQVFTDFAYPTELKLGADTPECVNYGCMAYMRGSVYQVREYLQVMSPDYRIYISGGSQSLLSFKDDEHIIYETNLVLKGLQRFAAYQY